MSAQVHSRQRSRDSVATWAGENTGGILSANNATLAAPISAATPSPTCASTPPGLGGGCGVVGNAITPRGFPGGRGLRRSLLACAGAACPEVAAARGQSVRPPPTRRHLFLSRRDRVTPARRSSAACPPSPPPDHPAATPAAPPFVSPQHAARCHPTKGPRSDLFATRHPNQEWLVDGGGSPPRGR